jgi:1-acyl-sn-glycerol-3-phosphate acyltransferase
MSREKLDEVEVPWYYHITRIGIKTFLAVLTRCQFTGKENIPRQGRLLVVSNHLSLIDPPLVGFLMLSREMAFIAKKELFRYSILFSWLIRLFGAIPVHRGQTNREALRQAEKALADGLALIVFPEGMRSRSFKLRAAYPGVALLACRSGAPILPIGISGTEQINGVTWLWRRPKIKVNIGQPFSLPQSNGDLNKVELTKLTGYIMEHIAELLPQQYQGEYATRKLDAVRN